MSEAPSPDLAKDLDLDQVVIQQFINEELDKQPQCKSIIANMLRSGVVEQALQTQRLSDYYSGLGEALPDGVTRFMDLPVPQWLKFFSAIKFELVYKFGSYDALDLVAEMPLRDLQNLGSIALGVDMDVALPGSHHMAMYEGPLIEVMRQQYFIEGRKLAFLTTNF